MTVRHAGDLDMANAGKIATQLDRQVAFDDLAVVAVELHLEVAGPDFPADGLGLVLAVRKNPGMSRVLIGSSNTVTPTRAAAALA